VVDRAQQNMAQIRQSRPDSGPGFKAKVLKTTPHPKPDTQEALAKVADRAQRALVAEGEQREGDAIAGALGAEEQGYEGDEAREAGKVATQRSEKVRHRVTERVCVCARERERERERGGAWERGA